VIPLPPTLTNILVFVVWIEETWTVSHLAHPPPLVPLALQFREPVEGAALSGETTRVLQDLRLMQEGYHHLTKWYKKSWWYVIRASIAVMSLARLLLVSRRLLWCLTDTEAASGRHDSALPGDQVVPNTATVSSEWKCLAQFQTYRPRSHSRSACLPTAQVFFRGKLFFIVRQRKRDCEDVQQRLMPPGSRGRDTYLILREGRRKRRSVHNHRQVRHIPLLFGRFL
jgi:hypothetical protein